MNEKDPEVIASRRLYTRDAKGRASAVEAELRRPTRQPTGEWGCVCSLHGLRDARLNVKARAIYGEDAVQALSLAMKFVDEMLMHSKDFAKGHLSWEAGGEGLGLEHFRQQHGGRAGDGIRMAEIVRSVEVHVGWSIPCTLRIDVLETKLGPHTHYSTRVWRTETYRIAPLGESLRKTRQTANETLLVEDPMFSTMNIAEKTPDSAIEATITKIKWQLFSAQNKSRRTKKGRR